MCDTNQSISLNSYRFIQICISGYESMFPELSGNIWQFMSPISILVKYVLENIKFIFPDNFLIHYWVYLLQKLP